MSGREQDEAADVRLSAALTAAREQWPDSDALARVRRGVAAAVGSSMPPSGSSQARLLRRSLRSSWLRGGGVIALMIGAGFGGWRMHTGLTQPPQPVALAAQVVAPPAATPTAVPAAPIAVVPLAPPAVTAPAAQPVALERASELRRKPARARVRPAGLAPAPPPAAPADPEAELALLRRALAALQQHPSQSLELVAQHERDYAQGIFGQEREVIAIDALLALQRTSAAETRARAFLARYPRSAHAPRIRALLGGDGTPPQVALEQHPR